MLLFHRSVKIALGGLTKILTVLVIAAAEAQAQENLADVRNTSDELQPKQIERRIVISIPDRKLALVVNGEVLKVYDIAVGTAQTPSPSGEFKIVHRIEKPTYYAPGVVIRPGNKNPLGTRWIGLSRKGYGIHGTNEPLSIGKAASHGCIRMKNADVEELFSLVRGGDVVQLHAERNAEVAALFGAPELPATTPPKPPVPVVAAVVPNL
jgi:lipoprotein-anchoring transpeptidase ErfK/SrfK